MSSKPVARDWLILSLKWSTGDWFVWYCTASAGYTASLMLAGRYTEAEARGAQRGSPENCLAVRLKDVAPLTQLQTALLNDGRTLKRLKRLATKPTEAA